MVHSTSSLESSYIGDSALIDKETGRVLWDSSSLSVNLVPRLKELGFVHVKATLLSALLLSSLIGTIARRKLSNLEKPLVAILLKWTLLKLPVLDRWFLILTALLYLMESYMCSTRRFLANAISDTKLEDYIETLRQQSPQITWKVRCFHYEPSIILRGQKRVVTSTQTKSYDFFKSLDKTVVGIWKRAMFDNAPFTKLVLNKLVILANAKSRQDYQKQQAAFVTEHGQGDEFAEFSTEINIPDFRPRLLAERAVPGVYSTKVFRLVYFWIFTLLGLTVPFRMWFADHCDEIRVTVVKELYADDPQSSSSTSSWLFRRRPQVSTEIDAAVEASQAETFRLEMERLRLYRRANNDTNAAASLENNKEGEESAATAILEDVTAASIAAATNLNETSSVEQEDDGEQTDSAVVDSPSSSEKNLPDDNNDKSTTHEE